MSWAIEAIEKAAMERAREKLSVQPVYFFGFSPQQIQAFDYFFQEKIGADPRRFTGQEIIEKLRARFK